MRCLIMEHRRQSTISMLTVEQMEHGHRDAIAQKKKDSIHKVENP